MKCAVPEISPLDGLAAPQGRFLPEGDVVHSGSWAVILDRSAHPSGNFSTITTAIPIGFTGATIELRGFLRTRDVSGFAGLWMREDGDDAGALEFDNSQRQKFAGTHDWQEFSVGLPLNADATHLVFGALLSGTGIAWVDDLQLLVDGKPVTEAAQRAPEQEETDHTFDQGSGVQLAKLTPVQIENLATLGQVWGFVKYHDATITAGRRRWDYELFRVMPGVLAADSRDASNEVLTKWIDDLSPVDHIRLYVARSYRSESETGYCMDRRRGVFRRFLEPTAAEHLPERVRNQQYYVSLAPNVKNCLFRHESAYGSLHFPTRDTSFSHSSDCGTSSSTGLPTAMWWGKTGITCSANSFRACRWRRIRTRMRAPCSD